MKARAVWILGGVILIAAIVAVAAGGPRLLRGAAAADNNQETAQVTTMTAITGIDSSGTVAPRQMASLAWRTSGTIEAVAVAAGDQVKAGDALITLDVNSAPANVLQAQSDLIAAQNALDDLLQPASALSLANAQKAVADAREQVDKSQRDLRNLTAPNVTWYQDQVAERERALLTARQNAEVTDLGGVAQALRNAQEDLRLKANQLNDVQVAMQECPGCNTVFAAATGRFISPADAQQQYNDAMAALRVAEINYEQAATHSRQAVERAQSDLDTAVANLAAAQNDPDAIRLAQRQAALAVAEASLAEAEKSLAELQAGPDADDLAAARVRVQMAQATLDSLVMTAPFDGEVLALNVHAGDVVGQGTVGLTLANRARLHVDVPIDESEISQVATGQAVTLTVDALGGRQYAGQVAEVSAFGETVQGLVRYNVRVDVTDGDPQLLLNMTANVLIVVAVEENALAVPLNAVQFDSDGEYVLRLRADGTTQRVPVITGPMNGDLIAVQGNLLTGDTLQIGPPPQQRTPRGFPFGG
jgi:HlyD family secretion protein